MAASNMERVLGELSGTLHSLAATVQDERDVARDSRGRIFDELSDMKSRVTSMEDTMKSMRPEVTELSNWRQRAIGMIMVFSAMGAAIGAGLVMAWNKLTGSHI